MVAQAQTQNPLPGILKNKQKVLGDITNSAPKDSLQEKDKHRGGGAGILLEKKKRVPAPKVFIFEKQKTQTQTRTQPEPEPQPVTVSPESSPEKEAEDPELAAVECGSEGGTVVNSLLGGAVVDNPTKDAFDEATEPSAGQEDNVTPALFGKGDAVYYADESSNTVKARVIDTKQGSTNTYIVMLVDSNKFVCSVGEKQLSPRRAESPHNHVYWNSIDARKLFRPAKGETVLSAIDNQINVLEGALKSHDGWKSIVNGGDDPDELLFNAAEIRVLQQKALYVSTALRIVRQKMPWFSWTECCKEAVESLKAKGVTTYTSDGYVATMYRHFRAHRQIQGPKRVEKKLEHASFDMTSGLFNDFEDESD